jgi:hypothetical protein
MNEVRERLERLAALLRDDRIGFTPLEDGTSVLLDPEALEVLSLNPSATCVIECLRAGECDPGMIADALVAAFDVGRDRALTDVEEFVALLAERFLSPADS